MKLWISSILLLKCKPVRRWRVLSFIKQEVSQPKRLTTGLGAKGSKISRQFGTVDGSPSYNTQGNYSS
jgi:hypothetical protein